MAPHHIRIEFDDHMMWGRPSIRGLIVPEIVPASRQNLTPRAKRSQPSGSGKRSSWLDLFEKATMAERLKGVFQTAAFVEFDRKSRCFHRDKPTNSGAHSEEDGDYSGRANGVRYAPLRLPVVRCSTSASAQSVGPGGVSCAAQLARPTGGAICLWP